MMWGKLGAWNSIDANASLARRDNAAG